MAHHGFGFHHLSKRKKREFVDIAFYLIGALMIILTIPQFTNIWILKQTTGVSILTWASYLIGAIAWFIYGIVHKQKPIMVLYSFWILLDLLIVLGLAIY